MAIDAIHYAGPATRGDVGGIAINVSIALNEVAKALKGLRSGEDIEEGIVKIQEVAEYLDKQFDILASWTAD